VAVFWTLALSQIPQDSLILWMPVFILSNILINTFYFIAGLVLLEKAEGTLIAQSVTPLRPWEYLTSKVVTLAILSICESFVIVLLGYGAAFEPLPLLLGVLSSAVLFSLAGFVAVVRYDSINEFLFPSFFFTLFLVPPFLSYIGLTGGAWMYLHPLQGPLLLTQAGFGQIVSWQALFPSLYSMLWIGTALFLSRRLLERFVITVEGQ
jgi:fluoroquinolone transport system permease protein